LRAAADGRIIWHSVRLSRRDLEGAFEFVHLASSAEEIEPFPSEVVESLGRLVPAESVGYYEWQLESRRRPTVAVEAPTVTTPPEVAEARSELCCTYPLSILRLSSARRPCRLSDFLSLRELHRLDYYDYVLRPFGVEHQLRLFLPSPAGVSRVFYFNRERRDRDFSDRDAGLLELLRPFLVAIRRRFGPGETAPPLDGERLTTRELEVLGWVARGKTNPEIARQLFVSTHTVRKHLENTYAKLGVHTRTAAVARTFAPLN
jgi:DNA-binding CsgD family transcriptional regulator